METASAPFSAFIVDDEPYIVEGMVRTYDWAGAGFAVCGWAYSGEEALKKLDALRPDVLFVDVRMQNMDGLELIRRVRERLPVIFTPSFP